MRAREGNTIADTNPSAPVRLLLAIFDLPAHLLCIRLFKYKICRTNVLKLQLLERGTSTGSRDCCTEEHLCLIAKKTEI